MRQEIQLYLHIWNWQRIKFKTMQSNVLLVGEAGDLDMEFPSCLEVKGRQEGEHELMEVDSGSRDNNHGIFSFPEV